MTERFAGAFTSKIYVAGHRGLVGQAIVRALQARGYRNLLTRTSAELDLRDGRAVAEFLGREQPAYIFMAAARVGGIRANQTYPATFLYDNLAIALNVIQQAYRAKTRKLLFLGSSCIYPRLCSQPIKEEYLLTGSLEPTNEAYAVAKIAGIKLCQAYNRQFDTNFISVMPANLYGPGDNFDLETAHVLPALIRKFHDAVKNQVPQVEIWGTGEPKREFLYVDDLADACLLLMDCYDGNEQINIGTGRDLTIRELADLIAGVTGYQGKIVYNPDQPDGTPRKVLDISRLNRLGWQPAVSLTDGIRRTYQWYVDHLAEAARRRPVPSL